jgi:hypothetical protein
VDGFSLHAGVAAKAQERKKLERICRYIARPPVAGKCLSLTRNEMVHYELKTPYRDGTTHVIFEPLDFISKLAALVPKPRVNLTRFHGVFAPNSRLRKLITRAVPRFSDRYLRRYFHSIKRPISGRLICHTSYQASYPKSDVFVHGCRIQSTDQYHLLLLSLIRKHSDIPLHI